MDKLEITDAIIFQRVFIPQNHRSEQWKRWHDSIGVLLRGVDKEDIQRGDFITNCPRMKKAIELCGGKCYAVSQITGIERWC